MITLIIVLLFLSVIFGLIVYLLMGTWIAGLVCFLACVITVCITIFTNKLIRKNKK